MGNYTVAENDLAGKALCKVDWYAFTIGTRGAFDGFGPDVLSAVSAALRPILGGAWEPIAIGHSWEIKERPGFYQFVATHTDGKFRVSWGNINPNIYVELPGQACDYIRGLGAFENLVQKTATRASRVDLAVDFKCDVKPEDFVVKGYRATYKGSGHISSVQGDTSYVGSRKGERFARVYRYHEPHPRAAYLRCEAEFKGDAARAAAQAIIDLGETEAVWSAHSCFDWQADLWRLAVPASSPLRSRPSDKAGRGELRWLSAAVEPALRKYHKDGLLDLETWFKSLLDSLSDEDPPTLPQD